MRAFAQEALGHNPGNSGRAVADLLANLIANVQLAAVLFLAVAVAEIHHQLLGQIKFTQGIAGFGQILSVIIWLFAAAHNDMAVWVAAGLIDGHLTVLIRRQEHMAGAGCADGIHRNAGIAVGAVFKAHRAGERRSHFTVDLAFSGAGTNSPPADQIGDKLSGHHIEEFGSSGNAQLVNLQQQFARQLNAVIYPVAAVQIGIGDQPFPAHHGARLLKVGAHHDFKAGVVFIPQPFQALGIVHCGIKVVNRTGANNHQQAAIFTVKDFFNTFT